MKTDIGEQITSIIVTLLIALPIIVDEVNKRIEEMKKDQHK